MLQQVPNDALGFLIVRNLAATDAKARNLFDALQIRLPGPMTMLRATAGIQAGLDRQQDMLVAMLPPENDSRQFHLAVWLPVSDYDALIRSLDGDPERRVAAVTVAGEDLLAVRHGPWAVVMDPDQRERLERLRTTPASPTTPLADWSSWIAAQDAALVVLPSGVPAAWHWATRQVEPKDVTGGSPLGPDRRRPPPRSDWWTLRGTLRDWLTAAPEFSRWAAEAQGAAIGLRADDAGNAVASLRIALPAALAASERAAGSHEWPRLGDADEFVVQGAGAASKRWTVPAVAPYMRNWASDLAANYGTLLDEADLARFTSAVQDAVANVEAFAVLTRAGERDEGVFTNNFLALRVTSDQEFLEKSNEAMRLWNEMLGKAEGPLRLVFDARPIKFGERAGTEYSIDMAAAVGAPALPEMRQTMERLFGPGGAFRLQLVAIDDRTVLLAAATEAQVAKAIAAMDRPPAESGHPALDLTTKLLPSEADWRIYVSPHGYFAWLKRQMDAVLGPVIGGPVVRAFPESPPLGATGGVDGPLLWFELAAPEQTLRQVGEYVGQ